MNRNIATLCQQRQYIFPSPTPVKVAVDIKIHKIIESYETCKKEDYVGYDVKKQKMVKNAKRKSKNNENRCKNQHTDNSYREPIIAGRGKYGKVLENYKIPKKSNQTNKSSHKKQPFSDHLAEKTKKKKKTKQSKTKQKKDKTKNKPKNDRKTALFRASIDHERTAFL